MKSLGLVESGPVKLLQCSQSPRLLSFSSGTPRIWLLFSLQDDSSFLPNLFCNIMPTFQDRKTKRPGAVNSTSLLKNFPKSSTQWPLLISYWPELCHMASFSFKEGWRKFKELFNWAHCHHQHNQDSISKNGEANEYWIGNQ